jgi:hypothetical protein
MSIKHCTCAAWYSQECCCRAGNDIVEIDLQDIKQNGLKLGSPLLWALLPYDYLCMQDGCFWLNTKVKPDWCNERNKFYINAPVFKVSEYKLFNFGLPVTLKINYTGDWKDSLTKRPKGY